MTPAISIVRTLIAAHSQYKLQSKELNIEDKALSANVSGLPDANTDEPSSVSANNNEADKSVRPKQQQVILLCSSRHWSDTLGQVYQCTFTLYVNLYTSMNGES